MRRGRPTDIICQLCVQFLAPWQAWLQHFIDRVIHSDNAGRWWWNTWCQVPRPWLKCTEDSPASEWGQNYQFNWWPPCSLWIAAFACWLELWASCGWEQRMPMPFYPLCCFNTEQEDRSLLVMIVGCLHPRMLNSALSIFHFCRPLSEQM